MILVSAIIAGSLLLNQQAVMAQQQQQLLKKTGTINGVGTSEAPGGVCSSFHNNDFLTIHFDASYLLSQDEKTGKVTSGTGIVKTTYSNVYGHLSITGGTINIGVEPRLYSLKGTVAFQSSSYCNLPSKVEFSIAKPDGSQLKCGNSDPITFNSIPLTETISGRVDCDTIAPTVIKDTTAPTVIATLAPKMPDSQKLIRVHPVTLTWSGDDGPRGSGIASCDSPTSYSGPDRSSILLVGHCRDKAGNVGTGSIIISYESSPPNINIPQSITKEATSPTGAIVAYTVSASDALDGTFYITSGCFPSSGSTFKFGTTTVTCKAADSAGNVAASKAFTVIVQHTTPPQNVRIISAVENNNVRPNGATTTATINPSSPKSITIQLSHPTDITGITSLQYSFDGSTTDCPSGSISYSNLHPGSHTFTFTAKNAAGNSAYDRFSWTIPSDVVQPRLQANK